MTTHIHDPRVMIVATALSERQLEDSARDHYTGSMELAEVAIRTLDAWLHAQFVEARRNGLPNPRLYGHRFCDCTELVNEIMRPKPQTERPDRDN